jgi:glutamate-1-semialdehyde 2,1-aminomutase
MHSALLNKGIYIGPSGYEVGFISSAHSSEILEEVADTFCEVLDEMYVV